jgi:copper transport protein
MPTATRVLDLVVLALLVGAAATWLVLVRAVAARGRAQEEVLARVRARCRSLLLATATIAVISGELRFVTDDQARRHGFDIALRSALLLLLVVVVARARRSVPVRVLVPLLLAGIALAEAHASRVMAPRGTVANNVVLAVHLLAATALVGCVFVLAIMVLPLLRRRDGPERDVASVFLRAVGAPATLAFVVLAVTGLHLAGRQVASPDALLRTPYGHLLLVKVALTGAVALLALASWRIVRDVAPRGPDPTIRLEIAGALAVLAVAALLAGAPPARRVAFEGSGTALGSASAKSDDLLLHIAVVPNRHGRNIVTVTVDDTRRPAPAPIADVDIRLQRPFAEPIVGPTRAFRIAPSQWQLPVELLDAPGQRLIVRVSRPGMTASRLEIPWSPTAPGAPGVILSDRPLAPLADRLALALIAGALAVVVWRRTPASSERTPVILERAAK